MRKSSRNPWVLIILLFIGAISGSIVGGLLKGNHFLFWVNLGVSPDFGFKVDWNFFRLALDGAVRINIGSLIGFLLAIIAFIKI